MTTWTPKAKQVETWEDQARTRVFDPNVFDRLPIFDTGTITGFWSEKDRQSEIWTTVA